MATAIGRIDCPLCGADVEVHEQARGKLVNIQCRGGEGCGTVQAHGKGGQARIRALMRADAATTDEDAEQAEPSREPTNPEPVSSPTPAAQPAAPAAQPAALAPTRKPLFADFNDIFGGGDDDDDE